MDTYKYGFVVKTEEEIKEMLGPDLNTCSGDWADSFENSMKEFFGKECFKETSVRPGDTERTFKVRGFGWSFDVRWVRELKMCTFEKFAESSIPFADIKAVRVPDDIGHRVCMRASDAEDLVPENIAVALKGITVPEVECMYYDNSEALVEFLGFFWIPNELEVLYVEEDVLQEITGLEYIRDYKGKGVSYRAGVYLTPGLSTKDIYTDMSIFDKILYNSPLDNEPKVILQDRYVVPAKFLVVKVKP